MYKNKGWVSSGDFLGTGNVSYVKLAETYLPWKEAKPIYRRLARENDLIGRSDCNSFVKKNKKNVSQSSTMAPDKLPSQNNDTRGFALKKLTVFGEEGGGPIKFSKNHKNTLIFSNALISAYYGRDRRKARIWLN